MRTTDRKEELLAPERLQEFNTIVKDSSKVDVLFGYCYPSTYRAGMTGLVLHILYGILNSRADTSCERYFRYDTKSPALSVESQRPLRENHVLGFSLTYEEDIINLVQMLDFGGVPVLAEERTENDPLVVVGGPVVTANPEPFVDFVDSFVIGEGDLVINELVDAVATGPSRREVLARFSEISGFYVPAIPKTSVKRNIILDLDSLDYPLSQIVPDVAEGSQFDPVFGKSFLLEVTRGCGHSCRFCLIGHVCQPRRTRSLSKLKELVQNGIGNTPVSKVSMIGSSLGDLDGLEELVCWTGNQGLGVSVPSLRADSVTEPLLNCLVKSGQRTLTIAPETGSTDLRRHIGKGLSDTDIESAVEMAARCGYNSLKLYFIIGLPGETDDDITATVDMIVKLAKTSGMKVTASVNPFIPKAQTRWEREPQPSIGEIRRRLKIVERGVKKDSRVTVESLDPRSARIQAALSIGDRSLGKVIRAAARYGGYGGWRRAEKETGISFLDLASDTERLQEDLPWSYLRN
ncbi:MAG: radical SAM protein [Candidatus Thorarchaeota archaeon]|nr:radical SAM protein [Candidatus Thorarchaeota archaeon]